MQFILIAFILVIAVQFCYYIIFSKFYFIKNVNKKKPDIPVSIVVCARNESENISKNLPLLLSQDYGNFELVLINDGSSDDTLEIFENFKKNNGQFVPIKIVNVAQNEKFWGNKKFINFTKTHTITKF